MKVSIDPKVFQKLPGLRIAIILAKDIDNKSKLPESEHLLQEAENLIRLTFNKETIRNHNLISPWQAVRIEFGQEARHYQTSVEKMMEEVLRRKSVKAKDTLTNLVRYVSLKRILPIAVDDYHKILGDIKFTVGKDLCYRDNLRILGAKMDYWKNKETELSSKSISALIHLEALPPLERKQLQKAAEEIASLVTTFCGGKTSSYFLDRKKQVIPLD